MSAIPDGPLEARLLALLDAGVSKPADLVARAKAHKVAVRDTLKAMEARGLVESRGKTLSRRFYRAGSAPPTKEGPSRRRGVGPEEGVG